MSHLYCLRCTKCNEDSGDGFNHRPELLIKVAQRFSSIVELEKTGWQIGSEGIEFEGYVVDTSFIWFLRNHYGCNSLQVIGEYLSDLPIDINLKEEHPC